MSDPERDAKPDLDLETRREIYREIDDNPGIHFRGLFDEVSLAKGTLQYHLHWLEDEGLVESSDDGQFTRYYAAETFEEADQRVLNALRRKIARHVLTLLLVEDGLSTAELSDRLEKSRSTISWHLSKLDDTDLVEKRREGRRVIYELSDPERVRHLYTIYRRSFTDRMVDRMLDLWEGY